MLMYHKSVHKLCINKCHKIKLYERKNTLKQQLITFPARLTQILTQKRNNFLKRTTSILTQPSNILPQVLLQRVASDFIVPERATFRLVGRIFCLKGRQSFRLPDIDRSGFRAAIREYYEARRNL